MSFRIVALAVISLMMAGKVYAADPAYDPPPELLNPVGPKVNPPMPTEPPPDPARIAETNQKLRDHMRKIYAMALTAMKEKKTEQKEALIHMVYDCSYITHYSGTPRLKYSVADKEEQKLGKMLADDNLDAKEMGEWRKDMVEKVGLQKR